MVPRSHIVADPGGASRDWRVSGTRAVAADRITGLRSTESKRRLA
jgi:hypothetical protein